MATDPNGMNEGFLGADEAARAGSIRRDFTFTPKGDRAPHEELPVEKGREEGEQPDQPEGGQWLAAAARAGAARGTPRPRRGFGVPRPRRHPGHPPAGRRRVADY